MSKKSLMWTLAIVIIVALLVVQRLTTKKEGNGPGGRPSGPPPPVRVSVHVVKKQDLTNTIEAVGNIMAEEEVELKSETQGRIVKLLFEEGQEVQKGQLLLKISDADLQAELKKAVSTKKLKEENANRSKQLFDKGGISREAYDMASTDLQVANADIELLRERIRRTEIIAPFDGLIGLRNISEGGFVTNATTIARLQNIRKVKIEFSVPEKYASLVKKNNSITFTVEGQTGEFTATIYAIEPRIDPVSRNIIARATCDNAGRKLLPGAFARVSLALASNNAALMIPTQSVVPILKGQKVFLVSGDSAYEQKIKTGVRTENTIEVTEGLEEGDSVIVEGIMYVKQGSKVKVSSKQ